MKKSKNIKLENIYSIDDFDEIVANITGGIYTEPNKSLPKINFKALDQYCKIKNIKPHELSEEERNKFIVSGNK